MKRLMLLSAIIFLSACGTATIPVSAELQLPPALDLPTLSADSLQCLTEETYSTLVTRDKLQSERIKTLGAIIESTHEQ